MTSPREIDATNIPFTFNLILEGPYRALLAVVSCGFFKCRKVSIDIAMTSAPLSILNEVVF